MLSLLLLACSPSTIDTADNTSTHLGACAAGAPERRSIDLSAVRLDYACQGDGPTILMLHGFPEFWRAWDGVMPLLADGHRVVAPDLRGYNTSDKPEPVSDYQIEALVQDIVDLINQLGGPVVLVGHDWGGGLAWAVASLHPELIDKLVIMNAPHLNVFRDLLLNDPEQADAFSYAEFFASEGSEDVLAANDFGILTGMFADVLDEDELVAYKEAWGQPGALAGGLNWYRANLTDGIPNTELELNVSVPTLVMWGMDDTALLPSNLDGLPAYVSDLEVIEVPGATHWIAHEVPETVAGNIRAFVGD